MLRLLNTENALHSKDCWVLECISKPRCRNILDYCFLRILWYRNTNRVKVTQICDQYNITSHRSSTSQYRVRPRTKFTQLRCRLYMHASLNSVIDVEGRRQSSIVSNHIYRGQVLDSVDSVFISYISQIGIILE
jgi:hypothetical protein